MSITKAQYMYVNVRMLVRVDVVQSEHEDSQRENEVFAENVFMEDLAENYECIPGLVDVFMVDAEWADPNATVDEMEAYLTR